MGNPMWKGFARRPASPGAWLARRQRRRWTTLALGLVVVAAAAIWGITRMVRSGREPSRGVPAVVVLPFANLSGDPGQDYFADGMTEELQAALSQIRGLRVLGRTTTFALRGNSRDLRDLGRRLGVTAVLEGSVRRAGARVRVSAQLVDTRDGYQIWAQNYDREAGDVLALQDEIGRAVARALEITLLPRRGRPDAGGPLDPEVYNQYLLARRFLAPSTEEGFERAVKASEKAIALAPRFAPAWATLSAALAGRADYADDPAELAEDLRKALSAADRAIDLDPALAEAWATRGQLLAQTTFDWEGVSEDFDRALALAPGDADILRKKGAWVLAPQGRLSEAIDALRRATELDPLSASAWMSLGYLQVAASRGRDGEEALLRSMEIAPGNGYACQALSVRRLVQEDAAGALAEAGRCPKGLWQARGVALAEYALGHAREAEAALQDLEARFSVSSPFQVAEVRAWRGETDQAFAWLERAFGARDGGLMILAWDPLLDRVRGDPRMAAMLRRMNLPQR